MALVSVGSERPVERGWRRRNFVAEVCSKGSVQDSAKTKQPPEPNVMKRVINGVDGLHACNLHLSRRGGLGLSCKNNYGSGRNPDREFDRDLLLLC